MIRIYGSSVLTAPTTTAAADTTYSANEQVIITNVRTRLEELEAILQKAQILR